VAIATFALNRTAQKRDNDSARAQEKRDEADRRAQRERDEAAQRAQRERELEVQEKRRRDDHEIEERRRRNDQEIEDRRAQEAALQAYLDQMRALILAEGFFSSEKGSAARVLARAQTLTVRSTRSNRLKKSVLLFLHESKLIERGEPIISLAGANLRGIDLSRVDLKHANLEGANLSGADLSKAWVSHGGMATLDRLPYLAGEVADMMEDPSRHKELFEGATEIDPVSDFSGANLKGADLREADLREANLEDVDLYQTSLKDARLSGTTLRYANLSHVLGLNEKQLEVARGNKTTKLPYPLEHPKAWDSSFRI
jgi:uncharacterized protein YjbI with pentapeptide repeats